MNFKKIIGLCLCLLCVLIFLTGCSNEDIDLNDKAVSELEFLDSKFIEILNKLNNITFENYRVTSEKVELSKNSAKSGKESSSTSLQSDGGETAKVESSEDSKDADSNNTIITSQMSPNTILNPITTDIDWASLKNEIENIYYSWNTILLDLYQLDISNDDILGFSSDLNKTTAYIKNEDKTNSVLAMANLYSYLPKYVDIVSDDAAYNNIFRTKSFILNAYALTETGDWELVKAEIDKANETFKSITTDANFLSQKSYRVNKSYVLLNELRNSLSTEDKDIFYIHYKNLLEEINDL